MKGLFILVLLAALAVGGNIVAFNVWGFDVRVWAQDLMAQDATTPAAVEDTAAETPAAPTGPLAWMQGDAALRDTFAADEITSERYVVFEELVEPEELLNLGEALPNEDLIELYAAARTPVRMIGYCSEVLATIGATCDVIHTEVSDNRDGRLQLSGRLGFAAGVRLGEPEQVENGALISTQVVLPFEGDLRPANEPSSRIDMIRQAQSACDTLRAQFGNCVLTRVNLNIYELWITDLEVLPAGTDPQRIEATARFTVYADSTEWDTQSFNTLVSELVNPS